MQNSLQCLAFFFTNLVVLTSAVEDQPSCCGNASLVLGDFRNCQNGQIPLLKCEEEESRATFIISFGSKFATDDEGKYLINSDGQKVHFPHYCIDKQMNKSLVMFCVKKAISTNATTAAENSKSSSFSQLLISIETVFCLVSGVLLAITTLIYFIIPQTQDIEGKCTFNLILMQCFFYFFSAFLRTARQNELALVNDFCIIHWYVAVFIQLCYFTWSALLLHYMWKRFRQNFRVDESKLMNQYRMIAYGIPALLIVLCNIHAHAYSIFTKNDIERVCYNHQVLLLTLYGGLPIITLEIMCAFFFVCLQRHLWIVQPTRSPENPATPLKRFKFRFFLIAKLFTITGLPWLLILFFGILFQLTHSIIVAYTIRGITTFITFEGILLFYILVIGRKHVYRGLADKFGITMRGWQQDPDSEESIDHGDEN